MALLINIDTSTSIGSVCLSNQGIPLKTLFCDHQQKHAAHLQNLIGILMEEFKVDPDQVGGIAIAGGPGSYTGLRVATATAKGLCYAWGIPLLSINSLEMMASGMIQLLKGSPGLYCPMIDARRQEVYTAIYQSDLTTVLDPCQMILKSDSFLTFENETRFYFFGDGSQKWRKVNPLLGGAEFPDFSPSASFLVPIAEKAFQLRQFQDLAYFEPFYLQSFFQT